MSLLQILLNVFDIVFDFWPLLLLGAPLRSRKGNPVRIMFALWAFWAFVRVMLMFNPESITPSLLIPEPWNTLLFFATGAVLGGVLAVQGYFKRQKVLRQASRMQGREDLLALSPAAFEEMVAEMFRAMGHQAKRTGRSGDHGVDIVVRTRKGAKWIVQCKRWRKAVGEGVVRDFYGTLQHEKANGGIIIGVSGFSRSAREWAKGKPIRLVSGEELLRMWRKVAGVRKRR